MQAHWRHKKQMDWLFQAAERKDFVVFGTQLELTRLGWNSTCASIRRNYYWNKGTLPKQDALANELAGGHEASSESALR